jgi:hypothetical protein
MVLLLYFSPHINSVALLKISGENLIMKLFHFGVKYQGKFKIIITVLWQNTRSGSTNDIGLFATVYIKFFVPKN